MVSHRGYSHRGELLAIRRRALGLSQPALAAILGVHESSITRWEHNQRRLPDMVFLVLDCLENKPENMVSLLAWIAKLQSDEEQKGGEETERD